MDPNTDVGTVINAKAASTLPDASKPQFRTAPACCLATRRRARFTRRHCWTMSRPIASWCAKRPLVPSCRSFVVRTTSDTSSPSQTQQPSVFRRGVHKPARHHHPLRRCPGRRLRQRVGSSGIPDRADAVRRHQGFRPRSQGGRAGGHEELYECENLLAAVVRQTSIQEFGRGRFISDQDLAEARQQAGANNGDLVLASGG